jgi:hypothetical protein
LNIECYAVADKERSVRCYPETLQSEAVDLWPRLGVSDDARSNDDIKVPSNSRSFESWFQTGRPIGHYTHSNAATVNCAQHSVRFREDFPAVYEERVFHQSSSVPTIAGELRELERARDVADPSIRKIL